jgi:hypothetical protein
MNKRLVRQTTRPHSVALLFVAFTLSAFAQERSPELIGRVDPVVYLATEQGGSVVHDRSLPLLLRVRLANPVAANARMQNEVVNAPLDTDQSQKSASVKPEEPGPRPSPIPIPSLRISSSGEPKEMIRFSLQRTDGTPINVTVRPLRSTEFPAGALVLDGTSNPQFFYGIDQTALATIAPGRYSIRAILSRKNAAPGEWAGEVQSAPLSIDLRSGELSAAQQIVDVQQAGRFYLHDRDYAMVEKQAAALLQLDKISVSAWELRGDAFLEQGKLDEAEKAFREALRNAELHTQSNIPRPLREPPQWLYQRLDKIRELRQRKP